MCYFLTQEGRTCTDDDDDGDDDDGDDDDDDVNGHILFRWVDNHQPDHCIIIPHTR